MPPVTVRILSLATLLGVGVSLSSPLAPSLAASSLADTAGAVAVNAVALAANATACDDIAGRYEVSVDLPGGGPADIELDLEQSECEVTGFVIAQNRTPITDGVVEGSTATFNFEAENQGTGGTLVIQWKLTFDGDDVTGTFSHELFGQAAVVGTRITG